MASLKDFSGRMIKLGKLTVENADKTIRKLTLAIDREVVLATPVDTGRARSNWSVGRNVAPRAVREPYSPGENLGLVDQANAQAAMQQAQEEVAKFKNGDTIFISNNVKYIGRLNNGHSAQAPEGFVEAAIMRGIRVIKTAKLIE